MVSAVLPGCDDVRVLAGECLFPSGLLLIHSRFVRVNPLLNALRLNEEGCWREGVKFSLFFS